jgi:membrane protein implicated in regulation of membrane protease activity
MLPLYLFALIVGGGLLLFSVAGSEMEMFGDAGDGTMAHEFFSVRALSYFLAGFGATGFLVGVFTDASFLSTLLWAAATGIIASGSAALLYGWLRETESGVVATTSDHLSGLPARVVVSVTPGSRGKVLVVSDGREVELLARLYGSADPECPRGSTVVIVEMEGETALVTPAAFLPS